MKFSVVPVVALSAVSVAATQHLARNPKHAQYLERRDQVFGRQASSSAPPASTPVSTPAGTPTAAPGPAVTTPTVPGTIIPPLSEILSGAPMQTPLTMFTTFQAGVTPTWVSGAPPLPTIAIVGTNYPELDRNPPTNSPQMQRWLSEIDLSKVPNLAVTKDGSCASDPAFAADTSRCWWTCGGCTRATDIAVCPDKQDWGVSYDDGPSPYTPKLINFLHEKNLTATFYVVGSRVISRPEMLQTEYMLGHEIAIHTWSHTPLTTLTNEQIVAELKWTQQAIKDVLGITPITMRPPYGDIDDRVRAVVAALGMVPVLWTGSGENEFDTKDWQIAGGGATGPSSFAAWQKIVATAGSLTTGFITLQHDLYQQSVDMAVGYIVPDALLHTPAFRIQSIIECLKKPRGAAYLEWANSTSTGGTTLSGSGTSTTGGSSNAPGGSGGNGSGASSSYAGLSTFAGVVGAGAAIAACVW